MTDIINPRIEDLRRRLADEIAAETARQESFGTEPEQGAIWWEEDRDGKWSASCAVRRGAVWQVLKPSALLDANWSDFVDALARFRGVRRVRNVTVLPVEIGAGTSPYAPVRFFWESDHA